MADMEARTQIVVQVKSGPEQHLEIGDCLTIGRSSNNSLILLESEVSRQHAEIRLVSPGRYRIADLGSSNGTWVNGRRLAISRDLHNGDVIQIGLTNLR